MKSVIRYAPLCLAVMAAHAHAQSVSPAWSAYRQQQTQAQAQPSERGAQATQPAQVEPRPAPAAAPVVQPQSTVTDRSAQRAPTRSAFFVGVQAGQGWIYDDIKQDLIGFNAGYRWQAGAVTQVGVELAYGTLKETTETTTYHDRYWGEISYDDTYPRARHLSVGANARFNFGSGRPVYGIARLGYWRANVGGTDYGGSDIAYGAYAGLGLGVDVTRHFNVNLVYNTYLYADGVYYDDYVNEYSINRADTVTLGAEIRF